MSKKLILFLGIGLSIFLIDLFLNPPNEDKTIYISNEEVIALINTWSLQVGREPNNDEIRSIIDSLIEEEILYREALKLELDKNDRIIKRRLAQKVEFLKQDDIQPSPADLEKFYDENKSKYVVEDLFTFSHHFFSDQDNSEIIARESLVKILNGEAVDSEPFILGNDLNFMSKIIL